MSKVTSRFLHVLVAMIGLQPVLASSASPDSQPPSPRDGQHDFDFEIGTWKTHVKRLVQPLSGSKTWVEYQGTSVVKKRWDGGANVVLLDVTAAA